MSVKTPGCGVVAPLVAVEDNPVFSLNLKDGFICAVRTIKSVLDGGDDGASAGVGEDNIPFFVGVPVGAGNFEFCVHVLIPLYIYQIRLTLSLSLHKYYSGFFALCQYLVAYFRKNF